MQKLTNRRKINTLDMQINTLTSLCLHPYVFHRNDEVKENWDYQQTFYEEDTDPSSSGQRALKYFLKANGTLQSFHVLLMHNTPIQHYSRAIFSISICSWAINEHNLLGWQTKVSQNCIIYILARLHDWHDTNFTQHRKE